MGWLIALAALVLIAMLPLGVQVSYNTGGPKAFLRAGPVNIQVYPARKNSDRKKAKKAANKPVSAEESKKKAGGPVSDFYPFAQLVWDFLCEFRTKIRVDLLEFKLMLAGGDPADLALNYGKAWAAIGNIWPRLETLLVIKKRNVEVLCDFVEDQSTISACLRFSITAARLLSLILRHGYRLLKEYFNFRNKRKGGTIS